MKYGQKRIKKALWQGPQDVQNLIVANLFREVHDNFEFQKNPSVFIEKWVQENSKENQLDKNHQKVINRLNSINEHGAFSTPKDFRVDL